MRMKILLPTYSCSLPIISNLTILSSDSSGLFIYKMATLYLWSHLLLNLLLAEHWLIVVDACIPFQFAVNTKLSQCIGNEWHATQIKLFYFQMCIPQCYEITNGLNQQLSKIIIRLQKYVLEWKFLQYVLSIPSFDLQIRLKYLS